MLRKRGDGPAAGPVEKASDDDGLPFAADVGHEDLSPRVAFLAHIGGEGFEGLLS